MKFTFIRDHLSMYAVRGCCRVLEVSPAGYYRRRQMTCSVRACRRKALAVKIHVVHAANHQVYGSPRIYHALKAAGETVSENTVAKVMKERQIRAKTKKKFVPRTTDSAHQQPVAPNVLDRDFTAEKPNQKWVTDITYIPTGEGWLYLAGVLDLDSRKIAGWSMQEHMQESLVAEALQMALVQRMPAAGLVHHSDRARSTPATTIASGCRSKA